MLVTIGVNSNSKERFIFNWSVVPCLIWVLDRTICTIWLNIIIYAKDVYRKTINQSHSLSVFDWFNKYTSRKSTYIESQGSFFDYLCPFNDGNVNCLVFMSCLSTHSKPMSRNPQRALMGYLQFSWDDLRFKILKQRDFFMTKK